MGLPLAAHLAAYWRVNGAWTEGRYWLGEALTAAGAAPPALRAAALLGAGELAFYQGDLVAATTHLERSLAFWRAEPPGPALAYTLSTLAWVRLGAGAVDEACDLAAAGRRVAQEHGTLASRAWALHISGHVARNDEDYPAATAHFAESLVLWQALDHVRDTGWAMLNLGEVARSQGDYMQARFLYEAGQVRFATLDDPSGQVWGRRNLGFVALAQEEIATAADHFITCLHLYRQLGNPRGIAVTLLGLAGVAIARQKPETAARLLGAANGMLTGLGVRLDQADQLAAGQITEAIQAALDPATYQAAVRNGHGWAPATAVSLAQTQAFPTPAPSTPLPANTV